MGYIDILLNHYITAAEKIQMNFARSDKGNEFVFYVLKTLADSLQRSLYYTCRS